MAVLVRVLVAVTTIALLVLGALLQHSRCRALDVFAPLRTA